MPRREKDRELARRRKREKERRKLRQKGLLTSSASKELVKDAGKKKPEKAVPTPKEEPRADSGPATPEG